MKKIAIVLTHPIQYYVPIFVGLANEKQFEFKVFYSGGIELVGNYDPEFKMNVKWDIPLLDGYPYVFCNNESSKPGSDKFNGIKGDDIIQKIEKYKPDGILIFGYAYSSHLSLIRHFKKHVPIFFRGDSHLINQENLFKRIVKWFYLRYIFSFVDYALYVGTENKKYYLFAGLKEHQLFFVPHAIEDARFKIKNQVSIESLKLKLGILETDRVLLFVGKIDTNKNIHTLLEAFNQADIINLKLLIVGVGEQYDLFKRQNSNKNILFVGFVNQQELPSYYHISDCLVLPSYSETWGLVVNEAMASGLAVITSKNVGSAADLIIENETGFTFDPNNSIELSNTIKKVFESKITLNKLKEASMNKIEKYSMQSLITSLTYSVKKALKDE